MSIHPVMQRLAEKLNRTDLPPFGPGDTVRVQVKIKEGDKERIQAFEGVVIAKKNGPQGSFTVRTDPNATGPIAVAVNPVTNMIYVANHGSNNVTAIAVEQCDNHGDGPERERSRSRSREFADESRLCCEQRQQQRDRNRRRDECHDHDKRS